jgi:hypothetical protein
MKISIITILLGIFFSVSLTPSQYADVKYQLTDFKEKVDEVVLMQDVISQQVTLNQRLHETAMEELQDTLAIYRTLSKIDAYQAALALKHKRRSVIKQHKTLFMGLSEKSRIARADSIINGNLDPRRRFIQSNLVVVYESPKEVSRMRRTPRKYYGD